MNAELELQDMGRTVSAAHTFTYRAVDAAGAVHAGEITSSNRIAALDVLSRRGLIPIEVREAATGSAGVRQRFTGISRLLRRQTHRSSQRELLALTQSLAALLSAGLTIDRALQITALLAPRQVARQLAEAILQSVRSGRTLSHAFAASRQPLPPYYVSMVEAGEIGGSLADALSRLAELLRRQLEVRERIRSALIYPSLLAGVVLLTLVMLLTFVLPRFDALFAESEAPLPWSTRAVLAAGRFVGDYWWVLFLSTAAVAVVFWQWLRSPTGRHRFDRWMLRSKLALGLPGSIDTARMLRTLSTLCRDGLPLPSALRIARGTLANRCLFDALGGVARDVQAGHSFSQSMARAGEFPAVAVQLSRVGEETGRLDELLLSAAQVLDEDNQTKLERLLTLLVPLMTIAMGLVVAGLIGSVLIGLLSINDLAF